MGAPELSLCNLGITKYSKKISHSYVFKVLIAYQFLIMMFFPYRYEMLVDLCINVTNANHYDNYGLWEIKSLIFEKVGKQKKEKKRSVEFMLELLFPPLAVYPVLTIFIAQTSNGGAFEGTNFSNSFFGHFRPLNFLLDGLL
uniref:Uncharacterized protein n=1 Tax=Cucumis melo TaxID=3656 RepID=A0A9I9EGU5_CUCME